MEGEGELSGPEVSVWGLPVSSSLIKNGESSKVPLFTVKGPFNHGSKIVAADDLLERRLRSDVNSPIALLRSD